MSPENWSHLISASVVPIVVISASGLLCLAFYNRLAAIVSRLRLFQRERLQQQELRDRAVAAKDTSTAVRHERLLDLLADETENVTKRAHLIRSTLMLFLLAIAALVVCSLMCGVTAVWKSAIYPAVAMFVTGMLLLLAGVICAILEIKMSLGPVELESEVIALLAP